MNRIGNSAYRTIFACCIATFWSGAIAFGYPGVMSTVWQDLFQVGSGETGLVVTIMLLGISVCTIISGRFLIRFGIRRCMLTGTGLMLIAMLILLNAKNIYMVYIWAFVVNVGASFVYGPGLTTAQKALPERKGLASGLLNLTFGLSAAIMSPIWEKILTSVGYSAVNISLIFCFLITNLIAALLVGTPETGSEPARPLPERGPLTADLTVSQALRTRSFWMIWLCWAFVGAAGISMVSLSKSYASGLGLSGVAVLMAFNLTNGIGRLIAGSLCDIIGGESTAMSAFLIAALGCLLLPVVRNQAGIAVLAACVGYGFGSLFASTGPIAARHFGMKNFSTIFGLIFTGYGCVGGIIGPLLAGIILERAENAYVIIFTYLAVFVLLGAVLMFLLGKMTPPAPQKLPGSETGAKPAAEEPHDP